MILTNPTVLVVPLALALGSPAPPMQEPERPEGMPDFSPRVAELQAEVARIPFHLGGGRPIPVVEAMVNGQGPFEFFYDTGASACVLDTGFVEELGIPLLGETQIGDHTANARIPAQHAEMESLELEGILFKGIRAIAMDRSRLGGDRIRGVLGLPLFRDQLLTLDYVSGHLEISKEKLPEKGEGILSYGGDLLPVITITIGDEEVPCHIDSGSPSGFMFPTSVVESLAHKTEPKLLGRARTVNSEFEIFSVQIDATIVMAGNEFVDPHVGYNEILPTGLFGYQILKDIELSIDQRSRRVRIVPAKAKPAEAAAPNVVDERKSGRRSLGVGLQGHNLMVSQVVEGSEAERAGLKVGDVLVTIDGEAITHEALGDALDGTESIRLGVERGGEVIEVVLFG